MTCRTGWNRRHEYPGSGSPLYYEDVFTGYYFVPVKAYIVFYRPDDDVVVMFVDRVFYGKSDYLRKLVLRSDEDDDGPLQALTEVAASVPEGKVQRRPKGQDLTGREGIPDTGHAEQIGQGEHREVGKDDIFENRKDR